MAGPPRARQVVPSPVGTGAGAGYPIACSPVVDMACPTPTAISGMRHQLLFSCSHHPLSVSRVPARTGENPGIADASPLPAGAYAGTLSGERGDQIASCAAPWPAAVRLLRAGRVP